MCIKECWVIILNFLEKESAFLFYKVFDIVTPFDEVEGRKLDEDSITIPVSVIPWETYWWILQFIVPLERLDPYGRIKDEARASQPQALAHIERKLRRTLTTIAKAPNSEEKSMRFLMKVRVPCA